MPGSATFFIGAALNNTLTMSGVLSGDLEDFYVTSQPGTVIYTGASTYSATNLTIQTANNVVCESSTCFGDAGNAVNLSNASDLTLDTSMFDYDMVVSDNGGTNPIVAQQDIVLSGDITIYGATIFDAVPGETFTLTGSVSGTGCLISDETIFDGAQYTFSLNGSTACSSYTSIQATGTLSIGATEFIFPPTISFEPSNGEIFTIASADDIDGEFIGLSNGDLVSATFSGDPLYFQFAYSPTDVRLTRISDTQASAILSPPTTAAPATTQVIPSAQSVGNLPTTGSPIEPLFIYGLSILMARLIILNVRLSF